MTCQLATQGSTPIRESEQAGLQSGASMETRMLMLPTANGTFFGGAASLPEQPPLDVLPSTLRAPYIFWVGILACLLTRFKYTSPDLDRIETLHCYLPRLLILCVRTASG